MNKDNLYIFDKSSKARSLLGEIQSNFNMSLTIDGTKDSMSCIVWGYNESEIEPYTICWHEKTNTWWVVSHDKVERYLNDSGFIYIHNLELLGAIELLNARDLTDCGFNDNTYSIFSFINRLFKLSTFEYTHQIVASENIDLNKMVNFIKTFENYTLLSALREFLDAYNFCPKLSFTQNASTHILEEADLIIIPKTGDSELTTHNMSDFDDVRETKTMDKNSFGTCVVSNAENVISKVAKTYPSTGAVRCSAHEYIIKAENAIIRLPSKVFKANWLKLVNTKAFVEASYSCGSQGPTTQNPNSMAINVNDINSFNESIDRLLDYIYSMDYSEYHDTENLGAFYNPCREALLAAKEDILRRLTLANTITLYDGINLEPNSDSTQYITKGKNMPYLVYADYYSKGDDNEVFIFCDKDTKNVLLKPWRAIAWERGSDEITGFEGFEPESGRTATITIRNLKYTDIQQDVALAAYGTTNANGSLNYFHFSNSYGELYIRIPTSGPWNIHFRDNAQWIVNYIPMSDIKIKVDNKRERNDIKLYNQNGKLTDNYALSKLINSYAKEISSDNITRFMNYLNYASVPQVGSFVYDSNNEPYIINNVSLTFTQNENTSSDFGYFIEGEFTMSKYVSTKSLMVNPNTNIRDYGIPQNYNVKRKQVYRDYYELNYDRSDTHETTYYLSADKVFNFEHYPNSDFNFICVMKFDYSRVIGNAVTYYYQLETTTYDLNKMFYVLLDFKDNNIIGYGSQNVYSGFVISRIISGQTDNINIPISYVDNAGEVKDINILFMDNETITSAYYNYVTLSGYSYDKDIYNYSVFIPSYIYTYCNGRESIKISETNYRKDALEVPVFEYGCQCEDTNEVLIGDDIFRQHSDYIYFYSYVEGDNLTQENATTSDSVESLTSPLRFRMLHSCVITNYLYGSQLGVILYSATTYNIETGEWENFTQNVFTAGKDYAIFRHAYNQKTGEEIVELLFIAKKVPMRALDIVGELMLYINHYQLK